MRRISHGTGRIFALSALGWLLAASLVHAAVWGDGMDRSRAGQRLLVHEMMQMETCVEPLRTISVDELPVVDVSAIGRAFGVPPAAVRQFRRGYALAPAGHPLDQTRWYTIWYDAFPGIQGPGQSTLRVERDGTIIEQKHW